MNSAVTDLLAARAQMPEGLRRLFWYSLSVHLLIGVAVVVMPSNWLSSQATKPNVMEVSLGGSVGPRTTGVAPVAGRRVEQAVPETKRPEPIKPVTTPKPDTMPVPKAATPAKVPEKTPVPTKTSAPMPAAVQRPKPATGQQVQAGSAAVETRATGLGQGLTQGGGGGTGGVVDLNTFDPVWTRQMTDSITRTWVHLQQETGWTEILFVLNREGKVTRREVAASSGSFVLNQAAERAVRDAIIPPLPRDFKEATLAVRLRFNYEVK